MPLSEGEYGALEALPRVLSLLDREALPATFFIPAISAILHPQMIPEIVKRSGTRSASMAGFTKSPQRSVIRSRRSGC